MKQIIFLSMLVIFGSCTDPKAKIVERQKALKDSILKVENRITDTQYKIRESVPFPGTWEDPGFKQKQHKRDSVNLLAEKFKSSSQGIAMDLSLLKYKRQYDSLEIELKKY